MSAKSSASPAKSSAKKAGGKPAPKKTKVVKADEADVKPTTEILAEKAAELDGFFEKQMELMKTMRRESSAFFRETLKKVKNGDKKLSFFLRKKEERKERREAKKVAKKG